MRKEFPSNIHPKSRPRAAHRAAGALRCFPDSRRRKSFPRLRTNWRMNSCTGAIAAAPRHAESAKTEAEATAFVVCHAIGLETGSAACDYIQLWNGDAQLLAGSLGHVRQAVSQMLTALTNA